MRLYMRERDVRIDGGVPSPRLFEEIAKSRCCESPVVLQKSGLFSCFKCKRTCDLKSLYMTRGEVKRRFPRVGEIHVKAKGPTVRPGQLDRRAVERADRWLLVQTLIEWTPIGMLGERWHFKLLAWEGLLSSLSLVDRLNLGQRYHPELGTWTESVVRYAITDARKIISRRASRSDWRVRIIEVLGEGYA